ncbi:hypothetical protein [Segniliparus rugosus]|uniref:Uncharacterized protein n=1 Tax=Segniliparus rugosus (strain ATCC BAA-974 / DSM 45345 / CCUG 50838 / CIP 108380 / JCM 13579 / CDC 945) TaxID=679197 RepID=E5XU30_SEGRC|nr:hypothetical protein [Segniliparus rugosus]EFV12146.1 hypothetical protein HMPREF9336_03002 [Segniliparus rugosus ATCC BAA-974]
MPGASEEKETGTSKGVFAGRLRGRRARLAESSFWLLPVYALYVPVMGVTGVDKFAHSDVVIPFYEREFASTFIAAFPGTALSMYGIALLEVSAAVAFLASLAAREFLPGRRKIFLKSGFFLASITFAALTFGQRVLSQSDRGSSHVLPFQLFVYTALTLVLWRLSANAEGKTTNDLHE